jgi:glycosidase
MSPFVASSFFPLSRAAREEFAFPHPTFSDFFLARELAAKLNATRDLQSQPQLSVKSGRLAAAALLDEVFAHLIARYSLEVEPDALEDAASFLDENVGARETASLLETLDQHFAPPVAPLQRPDALELLLRLHLANANPALESFKELFDDAPLGATAYDETMSTLGAFFQTLPAFGPDELDLLSLLKQPITRHPDSVEDQLRFVLERLGDLVEPFQSRLLLHLDLIREEEKPVFFGAGPSVVPTYPSQTNGASGSSELVGLSEYEAFSSDTEWMPRTVLLAKQTYVWLDQLSKRYGRHVARLDQVPDEELDEMASRGITGLWLIGVWERSKASQKIKRMTGNPDAISSAYSLKNYEVAQELGGWAGLENLKSRALKRGIRMASDMVPNHTGLDSDWMMEHPDWFLSLDHPPFPSSSFDGPDLSDDGRAALFLENGYYSQSDASVVFRRLDRSSGQNRFVYHGNDGTNMAWNDTAQLDYLKPEVRHAVMQTILAVARHFPIIRFDAAMTLAKKHIHRLWFPAPGSGGDIPSRAGRGVSAAQFDALMPQEFWREVVDTVATEVPGTLLLAEAFWMMEGYFVRTLGMHRVYNSAFMNMLRDEENANYRLLIKNTLEFDRDILGRFVNFMNNPDEDTAASRFGKGDKYFAVATLLSTMPGLPMWGHGQIEGFEEKYGMEYPRAYWDEKPDAGFILHHERVIFPLLRKRALFAGSEHFRLFDLWNGEGYVDEDVFAFSNRLGDERALVIVNNRNTPASGWLHHSSGWLEKGQSEVRQQSLVEALGLSPGRSSYAILRDNTSGLEFIRSSSDIAERGLYVELPAYGTQVFWNWREVRDEAGLYSRLAARLNGEGVPSIERALRELLLEPLDAPFRGLCEPKLWRDLLGVDAGVTSSLDELADGVGAGLTSSSNRVSVTGLEEDGSPAPLNTPTLIEEAEGLKVNATPAPATVDFSEEVISSTSTSSQSAAKTELERRLRAFARAATVFMSASNEIEEFAGATMALVERALSWPDARRRPFWLGYALLAETGRLNGAPDVGAQSRLWADEWLLAEMVEQTWCELGLNPDGWRAQLQIALSATSVSSRAGALAWFNALLADEATRALLGINNFEQTLWFNQQGAEQLVAFLREAERFEGASWPLDELEAAMEKADFRVVRWMELLRGPQNEAKAPLHSSVSQSV